MSSSDSRHSRDSVPPSAFESWRDGLVRLVGLLTNRRRSVRPGGISNDSRPIDRFIADELPISFFDALNFFQLARLPS
jgi:hypothetical protein